jgi:ABC-type transporter lipoprotein component MlaA
LKFLMFNFNVSLDAAFVKPIVDDFGNSCLC